MACTAAEGVNRSMCNSMNHQQSSSDHSFGSLSPPPPFPVILSSVFPSFRFLHRRCERWGTGRLARRPHVRYVTCSPALTMNNGGGIQGLLISVRSCSIYNALRSHTSCINAQVAECRSWSCIPARLLSDISFIEGPSPSSGKIT